MQSNPKFTPLETLEFRPARLIELSLFLDGKLSDAKYPPWVRRMGGALMKYVPEKTRRVCTTDAAHYLDGIAFGLLVVATKRPGVLKLAPTEHVRLERVLRTVDHEELSDRSRARGRAELSRRLARGLPRKEIYSKLSLPPKSREAFFYGFCHGLNLQQELSEWNLSRFRERDILRSYLWLRWPEMVEAGSIPAVYRKCRAAFNSRGGAHIVGSESAFRKFCTREGISFRRRAGIGKDHQKRA